MGFLDLIENVGVNLIEQPFYVKVIIFIGVILFILYSVVTKVLPKLFLVPPYNWIDKVVALLNNSNLRLRSTNKIGSYRRRLVLGSLRPSLYSTTDKIKGLKIAKIDKENEIQFLTQCKIKTPDDETRRKIYGVFHPYCNSGGGGEKVLWELVNQILKADTKNLVVIYHGEKATPKEILLNVQSMFHLTLNSDRIVFIHLESRRLIDPKTWPVLTLVGQLIGSMILCFEALYKLSPDVWIDSVGLPFSYPLVGLSLKIPILTYTHFPVIQDDMLNKLKKSSPYGLLKWIYWYLFMLLYKYCGSYVSLALVNSSWTYEHMTKIWNLPEGQIVKCYPVCSPDLLLQKSEVTVAADPEKAHPREKVIVSLSQFRDEKRHDLILKEYVKYLDRTSDSNPYKLKLIGSTRSEKDLEKVASLKKLIQDLKIPEEYVEFIINLKYDDLLKELISSEIGLNAMWNEHFGIVVVEYLAAGLIPLVHASAGPYLDIVVPWDLKNNEQAAEYNDETRTGFYFKSEQDPDFKPEFFDRDNFKHLSESLIEIEKLSELEKNQIRLRNRSLVQTKFSDEEFQKIVLKSLAYMDELEVYLRVDKRDKVEQLY